ncbi:MAG: hypothetical protein US49_C0001G0259 [candidate division TM6 bacterium GW2011_GWF2_37_49]|nr:MAG: hypothetical protein US49_C0001G0259 [candidate division TM6 bacterium GW2011_GWF2_37_49]
MKNLRLRFLVAVQLFIFYIIQVMFGMQSSSNVFLANPNLPTGGSQSMPMPPAAPVALVLQYADEKQIKDALNEAALPSIPLFGTTISDKSKYLIYDAFFKAPTSSLLPQISFETKLKIQSGMVADLIDPVLTLGDVTIKNLTDVSIVLGLCITNLKQINDDISKLKSTEVDQWKERFKNALTSANDKQSKLTTKLERQNNFLKKLDDLQLIPITQMKDKTDKLLSMLSFLIKEPNAKYKDIVNSLRDDFINAIARLVTTVQGASDDQKNIIIKFFDRLVATGSALTAQEQDKIKSFKLLLTTPTQPSAAPGGVIPPSQSGAGGQASGPVVGGGTPSLPVAPQLSAQSSPTTQQQANPLLDALSKLDTAGQDFDKIANACDFGLDALSKNLSSSEKQQLVSKIQEKINVVYDKRAALKNDTLLSIDKLLDKAKGIEAFKSFVTAQKTSTIKTAIALNNAYVLEKNYMQFSSELIKVIAVLSKDVSDYEKNRFSDAVDSLFANRKNDEIKKLGFEPIFAFKGLLDALNTPNFKAKLIFSNAVQSKFLSYSTVIAALMILLRPTLAKDLQSQLNFYRPVLDALSVPDTDYEKGLFFDMVTQIYATRGNFGYTELEKFKKFCEDVMNRPGVLSLAARTKLESEWLVELSNAINITPKADVGATQWKLYLEVLIESSMNLADFAKNVTEVYPKIFSLFTSDTSVRVINIFLTQLNDLVQGRDQIDKQKLIAFLSIKKLTIDKTGINEIASLLPDKQKDTLKAWIKTLTDELKAQKV